MSPLIDIILSDVIILISQQQYADAVKLIQRHKEHFVRNQDSLDNVMATLQPGPHTIVVAVVLSARLSLPVHSDADMDTLHATVQEFVKECDLQQLPFCQGYMCDLLEEYCRLLETRNCPMRGISVLMNAIAKLQTCNTKHHITGAHCLLLHLCLLAQCVKPALALLKQPCIQICKESEGVNAQRYLQYFYYGGIVYSVVKDYDSALHFFRICVSTPAVAISAVMNAAYKKLVLVSLLKDGKYPKVSKFMSSVVWRFIRPACQPYVELSLAFEQGAEPLRVALAQNEAAFARDGNLGLVKQLVVRQYKQNIQKLTRTFLTLSMTDVAARVKLDEEATAEKYLLDMIEDSDIHARINHQDGMVLFRDSEDAFDHSSTLDLLHERIEFVIALEGRVTEMGAQILTDPTYLKRVSTRQATTNPLSVDNYVP